MCVCVWRERGRGTRRVDKLQGARNNEAPVLGCIPEIGPSRGYKSHGTRRSSLDLKRPIDEFQGGCFRSVARGTNGYNIRVSLAMVLPSPNLYLFYLRTNILLSFSPSRSPFLFNLFLLGWRKQASKFLWEKNFVITVPRSFLFEY